MCDCDCELPKRERWKQISEEAARDAQAEIDRLKDRANKLYFLEVYGVDNWEGYSEAVSAYYADKAAEAQELPVRSIDFSGEDLSQEPDEWGYGSNGAIVDLRGDNHPCAKGCVC